MTSRRGQPETKSATSSLLGHPRLWRGQGERALAAVLRPRTNPLPKGEGEFRLAPPKSIAAELEALNRELFTHLIEARDAEVLAFEQVIARAANEFADGR